MSVVTLNLDLPAGQAPAGAKVQVWLAGTAGQPVVGYVAGVQIVGEYNVNLDTNGAGSLDLVGNDLIEPAGTVWGVRIKLPHGPNPDVFYLDVPSTGGPYDVEAVLAEAPGALPSAPLTTEIVRAEAAEVALGVRVDTETTNRQTQDGILASAIGTSVALTGDQTVAGVKTFSSSPIVPTPSGTTDAANKGYVLDQLDGFDIHALNHGIVADGVTDDTAAWKALIEPGGVGAGKSVYFPPKRVSIVSDELLPAHNTTVGNKSFGIVIDGVGDYGTGATFRWKSGTSGVGKYMWNTLNREAVHLRGVNFDGQFAAGLEAVLWDSTNSPANQWCSIENFQIAKFGVDGGTDGVAIHVGRSTVTNYQCDKNRIRFGYIAHVGRGIVVESANASDEMTVEGVAFSAYNVGIDVLSCGPMSFKAITFSSNMLGASPACIQVAGGNGILFDTVQSEGISTGETFFRVPSSAASDATNPVTFINCNAACAATNPATLGLIMDVQATKRIVGVGNQWGGNIKLAASAMYLQMGDTFANPNGAQARSIFDARTINGGPSLASITAALTYADVGQKVIGQFAAIPAATTITAVVSATTAAAWQATHAYVLGDFIRPTAANSHLYMCTTAGTSGGTEPTWVTGGTTNTDGSVVWQDCGLATGATLSANATATFAGSMGATFEMGVLLASINCDHLNLTPFANSNDPAMRVRSQRALGLLVEAVGNSTAATITLDNRITAASGNRYQIQINGGSFLIRNVSNGTIPFQIQTNTPNNSVVISSTGIALGAALTLAGDPTSALHAATKQYVDAETTRATAAEVANAASIATNATAISTETTRATAAEATKVPLGTETKLLTSGSYTCVVAGVYRIDVLGGGGGGGGGGSAAVAQLEGGGGGGGGGATSSVEVTVAAGAVLTVTIGAGGGSGSSGGSGGNGGGTGGTGGTSSVTGTGVSVSAIGGGPGRGSAASTTTGGAGGGWGTSAAGGVTGVMTPGQGSNGNDVRGGGPAFGLGGAGGAGGGAASTTLGGSGGGAGAASGAQSTPGSSGASATAAGTNGGTAAANTGAGGGGGGGGAAGTGAGGAGGVGGSGLVVIKQVG